VKETQRRLSKAKGLVSASFFVAKPKMHQK